MHIPDGFLSPQTYLPAYAIAAGAWTWAGKNIKRQLDESTVPRLAVITALSYALGIIMIPLPGGTSGHALGIALLALLFGIRTAFVSYSLVLLLQSLLFGAGGITSLAVNALSMGLAGASIAVFSRKLLARFGDTVSIALAAWMSVMFSGILVAIVLGVQPWIAHKADGSPLFFPFGLAVTLPAVLIPHCFIGIGEAVLTVLVLRYAHSRQWIPA